MASTNNLIAKYSNELILSLVWIIAIIIVNPVGEFPLNDDWAYSLDVFHLSQEGKLILSDWPAMTLIAQVLWGALVTCVFGFSFFVLRLSTLIIGLFTIVLFYRILINSGIHTRTSLAGAFLFMFSPLFFSSSFTFMTEVYFLFTLNLSLFCFLKFFKKEKIKYLYISSFLVLITTLIRQPGIAVGVAFAIIFLLNKPFSIKRLIISLIPTAISLSGYLAWSFWLKHNYNMPYYSDFDILIKQLAKVPVDFYIHRFGIIALYLGLFSLPVTIIIFPRFFKNLKLFEKGVILFLIVISIALGLLNDFPKGNVIYNLGLGPKLLKDTYWGENIHPILSGPVMYLIKLISLVSTAVVVPYFCIETIKGIMRILKTQSSPARLLRATFIVFFLFYFFFILINPHFYDRYLLPIIPSFFLIVLPLKPIVSKKRRLVFGLLMSVFVFYSVTATHDYLSWNRARWTAINYLTNEKKIEKQKIDGGFEFNGWFQTGPLNPMFKNRISWWFVSSDDYVISFGNIPGFKKIGEIDYRRMLPPGVDSICILSKEKTALELTYPIRCDCEKRSVDHFFFLTENKDIDFEGGNLQCSTESFSGNYSIKLDATNQYGLLSKYANVKAGERFIVKIWRKGIDNEAGIVISAEPVNILYQFNHTTKETNTKGWDLITSEIVIPENFSGHKLNIYVWNPGKKPVWFDDLVIIKMPNTDNKN